MYRMPDFLKCEIINFHTWKKSEFYRMWKMFSIDRSFIRVLDLERTPRRGFVVKGYRSIQSRLEVSTISSKLLVTIVYPIKQSNFSKIAGIDFSPTTIEKALSISFFSLLITHHCPVSIGRQ